ncbi:MAG: hypothetical protein WC028_20820 [Candidatus Obscuribacterales bacterium]
MRNDLLALTQEDLELYSNRGTVRRALSEIENGEPALSKFTELEDSLTFEWSDQVTCIFDAKVDLRKSNCSCSSITICRHLIRSVLHYQTIRWSSSAKETTTVDVPIQPIAENSQQGLQQPWWPGEISDQSIAQCAKKAMIKQAEVLFAEGQIATVSGGSKPRINFLSLAHTVRFLVSGDIRYAVCDCNDEAPCAHAILAVKCFRLVEAKENSQLIETVIKEKPPTDSLNVIEACLNSFLNHGLDSSNKESIRLLTLAKQHSDQLHHYFISELLEDLLQYREQLLLGDASMAPELLSTKLGELLARIDAARYRQGPKPLPLALVLGGKWNAPQAVKKISLTSLGSTAVQLRKQTVLTCYAIDSRTGQLCRIEKVYNNNAASQTSFEELARKPIIKSNSIADLAAANLLVTGAKLSPSRILTIGRSPLVVNPHDYNWASLPASIFHTDFTELESTLEGEHPSFLTDKSLQSSLKVAKINACHQKRFDYAEQSLVASCEDQFGHLAMLKLGYRSRAARGFELATQALSSNNFELRYIAGFWGYAGTKLTVHPITLVFENAGSRLALQPAVARTFNWPEANKNNNHALETSQSTNLNSDILPSVETLRQVGVIVSKGLLRIDSRNIQVLKELLQECDMCCSKLLHRAIEKVINIYEQSEQSFIDGETELNKSIKELLLVCFVINQESSTYQSN